MIIPTVPAFSPTSIEFFARFSRFEFALKEAGYLQALEDTKLVDAKADWDKLVALPEYLGLFERLRVDPNVSVLFERPPCKQIKSGAFLSWKDDGPNAVRDLQTLCIMVRRVRNNLFHGGKDGTTGTERDEELLKASINVLNQLLLNAPADVRSYFEGKY